MKLPPEAAMIFHPLKEWLIASAREHCYI
jgi:hypothetical protein